MTTSSLLKSVTIRKAISRFAIATALLATAISPLASFANGVASHAPETPSPPQSSALTNGLNSHASHAKRSNGTSYPWTRQYDWTRQFYIKTNLPAWLCLWTNIGAEADIDSHWSVDLSIYYSGFNYFKRTLKFRTFALMPELRFWPARDNDGFFIGAHFGMAYYNVALDGDYRYQDHDGSTPAVGGGITLGYRLPLRNPRWKLEFSAGAGIYHLNYDIFDNRTNGLLISRKSRTFYGLDRFTISLCYTFGHRNDEKKGGSR